MSALGVSGARGAGGGVPGRHGWPGPRSAGVGTRSALASRGTLVNRPVWYVPATAPERERHGEPGWTWQREHGWRSTSSASRISGSLTSRMLSQTFLKTIHRHDSHENEF